MKDDNFRFLEHTADIAVEVKGSSLEELFLSSARAYKEAVLEPFEIEKKETGEINLKEATAEELLVAFLSELNYNLLVKKLALYSVDNLLIIKQDHGYQLKAAITYEPVDEDKHTLKEEIKAVTFHQMNIQKTNDEYVTIIVFDI